MTCGVTMLLVKAEVEDGDTAKSFSLILLPTKRIVNMVTRVEHNSYSTMQTLTYLKICQIVSMVMTQAWIAAGVD